MTPTGETAQFGSFILRPTARRLEKDGLPVNLGGRALDILIQLVNRAGEIVSHQELQDKVWQDVVVEPNSLRVQVAALRKVLGETEGGSHTIINISGRGYCFVAPVQRAFAQPPRMPTDSEAALPKPRPLVGREQVVRNVIAYLVEKRFVTITGTGGVGKTAVAVAAAHALVPAFGEAVYFLDLGEVTSPHAAHVMLGRAALQRFVLADGAVAGLARSLHAKRMLIVLDCCDHIAGAMGELSAALVREGAEIHVLATSRERLGGERETVIALSPLPYPENADEVPLAALSDYAGVRLLTDLVRRAGTWLAPSDPDLRAMADMTRRLDGLPLALELAAASIAQNGIAQTASVIESRFALFMANPQAAMPRHASLGAALEWSYGQLTTEQRMIFRNLSVFSGPFTMDGILDVAADTDMDVQTVTGAALALLAKSMMLQEAGVESRRYRMLDTTRAFGLSKLLTFGDGDLAKRRHAAYMTRYLTRANAALPGPSTGRRSEGLISNIHNIRGALEWCFSEYGDATLGARLTAASAHVFNVLWLHEEGLHWSLKALSCLEEKWIGTQLELDVRFGIFVTANEPATLHHLPAQLPAIVALADKLSDPVWRTEMRAWDCMLMAQSRPITETVECARLVRDIALSSDDTPTKLLGDWLLGLAAHLRGDLHDVGPLCVSATTFVFPLESIYLTGAQATAQIGAIGSLARTLWLQGLPDAALRVARAALSRLGHGTINRQLARKFFAPLFIWCGACEDADNLLATVRQDSATELDAPTAEMYLGALSLRRGDLASAVLALRAAQGKFWSIAEQVLVATDLAEALSLQREFAAAKQAIDQAFTDADKLGDSFFTPERYRVMGVVMEIAPPAEAASAETWFLRAIDCARQQGSLSFALRAATNLARFYTARGGAAQAHTVLAEIYDQFTEGFDTPDLLAAREMLATLHATMRAPARLVVSG